MHLYKVYSNSTVGLFAWSVYMCNVLVTTRQLTITMTTNLWSDNLRLVCDAGAVVRSSRNQSQPIDPFRIMRHGDGKRHEGRERYRDRLAVTDRDKDIG